MLAYNIAKNNKEFSDAEFLKDKMLGAANIICPEVRTKFQAVLLSRRTIVCRIDAISHNEMSKSFQWYSLALDESTDLQDSAQILIFIRGSDAEFNINEEILSIESFKGTTTGEDCFKLPRKIRFTFNHFSKYYNQWSTCISREEGWHHKT